MEPLARATYRLRRALDAPSAVDRRERAERAIDHYLFWCAGYAAALARRSEREAAEYTATGVPASVLPQELAQIRPDRTHVALRTYRAWLAQLRAAGLYDGPTTLRRVCADGTGETLRLPGEDG